MRTWLSKTKGYVSEKPKDAFTGVKTNDGENIYEGDLIIITRISKRYIGKYDSKYGWQPISKREYENPKNWEIVEKRYSGIVQYENGRFFINEPTKRIAELERLYGALPRIELYPCMTHPNNYIYYKLEK